MRSIDVDGDADNFGKVAAVNDLIQGLKRRGRTEDLELVSFAMLSISHASLVGICPVLDPSSIHRC